VIAPTCETRTSAPRTVDALHRNPSAWGVRLTYAECARLRVLIADDSATMCKRLCDALAGDPTFEVVGEASSGDEAVTVRSAQAQRRHARHRDGRW